MKETTNVDRFLEHYKWDEKNMDTLQKLVRAFKDGATTDKEVNDLEKLANVYIASHRTGDHGYFPDSPPLGASFDEYAFYDLPNGLCLEGVAGNRQNVFRFTGSVFTAEERDKRIAELEAMAKDEE